MKVCKNGLNNVWINYASGQVQICGWTGYVVGNLQENSIEELWHGKKAEIFRQSLLDGSYRFCDKTICPYCANGNLEGEMVEYDVPEYPKLCSLSYEQQCNYACVFCRKEHYIPREGEKEGFNKIETEVRKFINQLDIIAANGVGELFCSDHTLKLLSSIKEEQKVSVSLESNGSLFSPSNWEKIKNLGSHHLSVYITVHSLNEDTYQFLSGTQMPVKNVIDNLLFIKSLRQKGVINFFEIATVVCERNFREMPGFVKKCLDEFNPDSIRLRFFIPHGVEDISIEWFYDIRNPYHPYYSEFVKVMQDPIFNDPRVWKWQGELLSELKEHPIESERKKMRLYNKLLDIKGFNDKFQNYLKCHSIEAFSLYGLSAVCKCFIRISEDAPFHFDKIYDGQYDYIKQYMGNKIYNPEEIIEDDPETIIVMAMQYNEINCKLDSMNYKGKIIYIGDVLDEIPVI